MGYRSDVAYVIVFETVEDLKKFVAVNQLIEERKQALNECRVEVGSSDDHPLISFSLSDVKWYESFDDVQAHNELLCYLDESEDIKAAAYFVRIGEEMEDIEQKEHGDQSLIYEAVDYIRIVRSVDLDVDTTPNGVTGIVGGL